MILILALRNLLRHSKNTILLSLLIAVITLIFFLGNSLLTQSDQGLRETYVDNMTADLMIQKTSDVTMNLFGANTPIIEDYFSIPVLPVYKQILSVLDQQDGIQTAALVSGKALMDFAGKREPVFLMGIEVPNYFSLFPGILLKEGRFLEQGEEGALISQLRADAIETATGNPVKIGDPVLLTSASKNSFRIKEVPLVGIYTYQNPGPYMEQIVLVDPQTVRSLSSILNAAAEDVEVEDEAMGLLEGDLDSLFGDDLFETIDENSDSFSVEDLRSDLQNRDEGTLPLSGGDWNFILLRLSPGQSSFSIQSRLNKLLSPLGCMVVDWRSAAGNAALSVLLLQRLFYGGIILLGLAGIISIVNIVLISVFRRTREIGTLRAIGASDAFITALILIENFILSLLAGLMGIIIGIVVVRYINALSLSFGNPLLSAIFGGNTLRINLQSSEALKALSLAVLLGFFSSLYPSWKAVCISPMEAVRKG